jgi:hypothetical protein
MEYFTKKLQIVAPGITSVNEEIERQKCTVGMFTASVTRQAMYDI